MSDKVNYPSAEIILEIAKNEYDSEKNRTSIIDSKSGIIISFTSVFFVAITQVINLKKLFNAEITDFSKTVLLSILFLSIVGSVVVTFISLIFMLRVIFTKTYYSIDSEYFLDVEKLQNEKDLYSIAVSQFYIEAANANKASNDQRVKLYRIGLVMLIIAICLFSIYMFFVSFI